MRETITLDRRRDAAVDDAFRTAVERPDADDFDIVSLRATRDAQQREATAVAAREKKTKRRPAG